MDKNLEWVFEMTRRASDSFGPDYIDFLFEASDDVPRQWRDMSPQRALDHLRLRLGMTQRELSRRSGVAQSQISRLFAGDDSRMSTWIRLYAALGLDLLLVPAAAMPFHKVEERFERPRRRSPRPSAWNKRRSSSDRPEP